MERKDWNYKTYLGDCIDGMRLLPAGSVDFLFTDLPYGRTNCKWDTPIDLEAFWSEADRVVKKNGAVALFAQTPFDKVLGCSNLRNSDGTVSQPTSTTVEAAFYRLADYEDTDREPAEIRKLEREYRTAVNELCAMCGRYKREHEGACDGCRWKNPV